jgi:hypothetical protein
MNSFLNTSPHHTTDIHFYRLLFPVVNTNKKTSDTIASDESSSILLKMDSIFSPFGSIYSAHLYNPLLIPR